MAKFRKKPAVIEAWRFPEDGRFSDLPPWLEAALNDDVAYWTGAGEKHSGPPDSLVIKTLEGRMAGSRGDWIIQGVQGEIYPCKPDIFAATYAPEVDDEVEVILSDTLARYMAGDWGLPIRWTGVDSELTGEIRLGSTVTMASDSPEEIEAAKRDIVTSLEHEIRRVIQGEPPTFRPEA